MLRRIVIGSTAALLLVSATSAVAQDKAWQIRARGLLIAPNASSTPTGLDVKANAVAEVDITRFIGKKFALELVLGTSSQEVTAKTGNTVSSLGMVSHLPPTLTFQFRPVPTGAFQPYLGAGGNLTYFYAKSGDLENLDLSTSIGYAFQGGADFALGGGAYFNLDVKYVNIQTDVKSGATKAYELKINPLLIGVGVGIRL